MKLTLFFQQTAITVSTFNPSPSKSPLNNIHPTPHATGEASVTHFLSGTISYQDCLLSSM
ncbi:MAG: hypothetical protein WCF23_16250 [Candidatus Nitrosopolaris sp.]